MVGAGEDEVSITYDASDFRALSRHCKGCRRLWIYTGLAFLAFGPGKEYFLDGVEGIALIYAAIPYLLVWLVTIAALHFLVPVLQVRQRRKSGWATPMTLRMNEAEIAVDHATQSVQHRWPAIKRVVRTDDRLFLFTTASCAFILPRRSFVSGAQFDSWSKRASAYWLAAHPA